MPFPQNPYVLYGTAPGYPSTAITAINRSTFEIQTSTTEVDSTYNIDCANFTNGYTNGDVIELLCGIFDVTGTIDETLFPAIRLVNIDHTDLYSPYPIFGSIPNYPSTTVTSTNLRTLETQSIINEADTQYLTECANFTSGYMNYDLIQVAITGVNYFISINMNNAEFHDKRQLDINPPHYNNNRLTQFN